MLLYLDTLIGFAVVMLVISLLITILTQMVSALLSHRGSNLRWGLKTLFEKIDPKAYSLLTANAETLANEVLRHPLISDSWFSGNRVAQRIAGEVPWLATLFNRFQLASAIRPQELVDVLRSIAANLPASLPAGLAGQIENLLAANNPSLAREMDQVAAAVGPAAKAIVGQGGTPLFLQDSVNAIRSTAGSLEAWFGSMMDRVAQKFTIYMRLWTVFFACAFAFGTGLNSVNLISGLYSNGSLRSALVGASQQLSATAATVLDSKNSLTAKLTDSLKQAIQNAKVAAPPVPSVPTTAEGIIWIQKNVPSSQIDAVTADFNTISAQASQKFIQDLAENATTVIGASKNAGFDVLKIYWRDNGFGQLTWDGRLQYLGGVLVTAALLSLGAPFWFNALKSLTNLRPILASKEKAEQS
jgi:hypothetical protein